MIQISDIRNLIVGHFFLPHHGVLKQSTTKTKLRVVFNGSCRTNGGVCINEALHAGAKLQIDIFNVLVIEQGIVIFVLLTVTYDLACAPFLPLRVILRLIQDEGHRFPLAIDILLKGRYIDDVFGGSDTIEKTREKASHVEQLCLSGGFPLRKWVANHPEILQSIDPAHQALPDSITIQDDTVHSLGLLWSPSSDHFHFKLSPSLSAHLTKRGVLSEIATFSDPLGLLSPLLIKAKLFLQNLWIVKVDWDEPLNPAHIMGWKSITQDLMGLETIFIPRWLGLVLVPLWKFMDFAMLPNPPWLQLFTYVLPPMLGYSALKLK